MKIRGDTVIPCAVQIWFSENAYGPITVRVTAPPIEDCVQQPTEISTSPGYYCSTGGEVTLEGVTLKKWVGISITARRQLSHSVELGSVHRLVIKSKRVSQASGAVDAEKMTLTIKLSESKYLSPDQMPKYEERGLLEFEQHCHLKTSHPVLGAVTFERRYRFTPSSVTDINVSSELVAVVSEPVKNYSGVDARATVELFNDFVLLASVASRHRVKTRGWKIDAPAQFEDAVVHPLESGAGISNSDEENVLIRREDACDFLKHCSETWRSFSDDEARKLRYACYALAPSAKQTIEGSYLAMFPALEGLISIYIARQESKGLVYSRNTTWETVRKEFKRAIDAIKVEDAFFNPNAIKQNLSALERVPFAESSKEVLKNLGAWSDLLWPLSDCKPPSLSKIRHLLAHGEQVDAHKLGALIVAKRHLRLTLERTLCCALGWSLEDTSASDAILLGSDRQFAEEIAAARAILSGNEPDPSSADLIPVQIL